MGDSGNYLYIYIAKLNKPTSQQLIFIEEFHPNGEVATTAQLKPFKTTEINGPSSGVKRSLLRFSNDL